MLHRRKVPFFLLPALFLVPVFLFILVSLALAGSYAQSFTPSPHGGLGGAYGAVSYALPASATATVTPTATPVVVQPKMYGGSGAKGACVGTSGAGNDMIKMDFGWSASFLSKRWKDYARYRLCNDHYIWEGVTGLPLQKVLQTLQWPPDLLLPQYANQIVVLQPLRSFDPNTLQALQAQQQASGQSTESNKNCLWHVSFAFLNADIDICQPIRLLVGAASSGIRSIYQNTTAQIDFLWQTPLKPFQDDKTSGLLTIWSTSWAIVLACITAVLAYGALRYMLGSVVNWLAYANLAELLPRLLFGLLAAYFSKEFFIMLIQANNALAGIFTHGSLDTVINGKASGVVDESLQIVYGLLGFLLIIEEAARVAIIYLLFAFGPALFFLASLRETQRWAKTAATVAVIFVFMQAIQLATLDVGGRILATVLHNTERQFGFLNLLVSLTILYVSLMLFFVLARMALGVGGGIFVPAASGVYRFHRWGIPAVAGAVGRTAAAYRQGRRNLFPLPPRYPPTWDMSSGSNRPGGFGDNEQASVATSAKPFIRNRNQPGGSGGPAGPEGNLLGGPAGSGSSAGNLPGESGASGAKAIQPAGGSSASNGGAGSSPTTRRGQWQKTPLARRLASGFDLINRRRNLNNAQTNQALKRLTKDRGDQP